MEFVRSRPAAIIVEVVFVLFPVPYPLYTDMLAVEQVAVDSRARLVIIKLPGIHLFYRSNTYWSLSSLGSGKLGSLGGNSPIDVFETL